MTMKLREVFWTLLLSFLFKSPLTEAYRKYYVEDECISPSEFQKIFFRLPEAGPDSVGELRSNRFGTYSRTGRSCLVKLLPPKGYGVLLTVLRVDFRNHEGCKDYIKIYDDEDAGEKLCGYKEVGLDGKTYFSDDEVKILYHTAAGGMGFSNGFRLIFTVTKLDGNASACSSPDEFMCRNSHCIWAGVQCDGVNNCGDSSDESTTDFPHCSTYLRLYKNFFSRLGEVTPIAIAAVVLGITSFIAILILMCLCCCRPQQPASYKPPFSGSFQIRSNAGYIPLPGYTFETVDRSFPYQQPVHSPVAQASAPIGYSHDYRHDTNEPYMQKKTEIGYSHPPPPPPYMA